MDTHYLTKTRQAGQQGRLVRSVVVPASTANIFAAASIRTNKTKQGRLAGPLSSLPNCDVYGGNKITLVTVTQHTKLQLYKYLLEWPLMDMQTIQRLN